MSHVYAPTDALSLRELLAGAEFVGTHDIRIRACTADSRSCRPGDLFVALDGTRLDAHAFAAEAVARGAVAVVAQRHLPIGAPQCVVSDAREAFGQICQALAGNPSRRLGVIGVTGTNGKTTTTHLIASVLQAAGQRAGLLGTLGYFDTVHSSPAELTTPAADTLAQWLGSMATHRCTHAVMEVSSHAIAQRRIAGLEFSRVCLTNLRRDHLDYHGTLAKYHHTKTELFNYLASGGVAIINADDPASTENVPMIPGGVLSIGMHHAADVTGRLLERCKSEQTFLITAGDSVAPVRTAMIGDHHIYNCLMAAAVGLCEGLDLATIVRGLENVGHVPGRLERVECGQPFGVYVDFAHTPDALAVALSTLREVTAGRILCVFGAGGNRDVDKRPLMGRTVESSADLAIVTNDNPRLEDPQTIASQILAGFERPEAGRWIPDRAEAINYALSLTGPDDCVLIAGKGHEGYQIVGHERIPLDDRDLVRRFLYNLAPDSQYGALMSVANSQDQRAMQDLTVAKLYEVTGGRLRLATLAPRQGEATRVGRIVTDSRQIQAGDVFWGLPGTRFDGAMFASEAYARGATGAVVGRKYVQPWPGCWSLEVNDAQDSLEALVRWVRSQMHGRVVAVTGSVGKTTSRQMIHAVLARQFNGSASPRNFNNHVGLPLSMMAIEPDHDYAVLEMAANAPGEIARLAALARPQVGVITRVGDAHLGGFGSLDGVADAKGELLDAISADGWAVLSGDDSRLRKQAAARRAKRIIWFGRSLDNDLVATNVECGQGELNFAVDGTRFSVNVWGRHHLAGALAAVAVGRVFGMCDAEIAAGLAGFESPPMRCQVTQVGGATIIDDTYNASPLAMGAALELLRDFDAPGRRIVVCGDMRELGEAAGPLHQRLGDQVVTLCGADLLLACGDHADDVVAGARAAGMPASQTMACRCPEELLSHSECSLRPGDVMLVKGSRALALERLVRAFQEREAQCVA